MRNRLRELLSGDAIVCGAFTTLADPAIVEMVGLAGYDFTQLDLEHTSHSLELLEDCLRAARAHNIGTWVRVPSLDPPVINRVLSIGADGIMVPDVNSAEQARRGASSVRYPPIGERGFFGASRATDYGAHGFPTNQALTETVNKETVFVALIESREGLQNCEAIASTPGVDVVIIGVGDLSVSLGVSNTPKHPDITSAIKRIAVACKVAGIPLALPLHHAAYPIGPQEAVDLGAQVILGGMDRILLMQGYKSTCANMRQVASLKPA